jgi:23S rRNA pseudouridine1911/1915/1917 synthase
MTPPSPQTARVPDDEHEAKLDAVVARLFPSLSRRLARQAILSGAVKLNGRVVKIFSRSVKTGDTLTLSSEAEKPKEERGSREQVTVLFEDRDLLVVDKPARLLSERVEGESGAAIGDVLQREGHGKTWLVHRLDAGTSGVMMLARNEASALTLSNAFREGQIEKSYLLLCVGNPGDGVYDAALGRDPAHPRRFAQRKDGKRSLTRYRTLAVRGEFALANARPETGRTHQIRVHFMAAGHVLLGDKLYQGPTKAKNAAGELALIDRPLLHAWALSFAHPRTGKALRFTVLPPSDFTKTAKVLGLDGNFDAHDPLW